jgi:hypothetical protein
MKKENFKILSLVVIVALSLSSCLKDREDFLGDFSNTPAIAELSESPNAATGTVTREIIDPTKTVDFKLRVGIAVAKPLGKDTKVTLAIDNTLIAGYNTEYSSSALAIPAAAITASTYDVIIPAGSLEADWTFSVDATKIPNIVDLFYMLPVKIASVDNGVTVSGNYGTKYIRVLSRNPWDGVYEVTGTMVDAANASLTGWYPRTIWLVTTGGSTCAVMDKAYTDNYYYPIKNGGSSSYYGSFGLNIGFDAATNTPNSISNYWGVVSNSRAGQIDATYANSVNPTTRDITLRFFMLQPTVITTAPYIRSTMTEVWAYKGVRP